MPSLTLIEAIEHKYKNIEEPYKPQDGSFVIFAPKVSRARDIIPTILILNDCDVEFAGEEERLKDLCKNVEEMDLSHNKLNNWSEIIKILEETPSVKFLNLSFNNLSSPLENSLSFTLPKLESLILIGTNVKWETVWKMLDLAPNLKELHLSLNTFETVNIPESNVFDSITKCTFDGNPLANWTELCKLGVVFPQLKQLSLSDSPIHLDFNAEEIEKNFTRLEILNISNTLIESCNEILALNAFPSLTELRTSGIVFLKDANDKDRRQELVAMLPKIVKLNGGAVISAEERDASERFYLRKYLKIDPKPSKLYFELQEKHGKLDPLVEINLKPVTKVNLKIKFGEMEVEKMINLYQSVRELKILLESVVGINPSQMNLYYVDVGMMNFGGDLLKFPDKQLYSYNMRDGDEIIVENKNNTNRDKSQNYVQFH